MIKVAINIGKDDILHEHYLAFDKLSVVTSRDETTNNDIVLNCSLDRLTSK